MQSEKAGRFPCRPGGLFHKFVDCGAKLVDGVPVTGSYRIHHAVTHMILQDHLTGVIQCGTNRCQLHQHLGAIIALFYHPLDLFQMTDGTGQSIHHSLLIFVDMAVRMGEAMGVHIGMVMIVVMMVMMVFMFVGVIVVFSHGYRLLLGYYTLFFPFSQAL